jgi:putative acetyltransferase
MIRIRSELPGDIEAIYSLNQEAFERTVEADLVNSLRAANAMTLSLVAVKDSEIVGHITFSPVTIESDQGAVDAVALGTMAVSPGLQRHGIGSQLVEEGLDRIRAAGHDIIIVIGHPEYYPCFGFVPAKAHGIRWEHDVPEEAFMVKELRQGALKEVRGTVRYRPEFNEV